MGEYDIRQKLIEIQEMFGDAYGSYEYHLVQGVMQAACELRAHSNRYKVLAGLNIPDSKDPDETLKVYWDLRNKGELLKADGILRKSEKLEREIAPKVLALARTLEIWGDEGHSEFEDYSLFATKKEEIRTYLESFYDAQETACRECFETYVQMVEDQESRMSAKLEKLFEESQHKDATVFSKWTEDDWKNFFEDDIDDGRDLFTNGQEFEIVKILGGCYRLMQSEYEDSMEKVKANTKHSSQFKKVALRQMQQILDFKRISEDVLRMYRLASHCLWLTFEASKDEDECSEVFASLAEHLTEAWEAILKKATLQVQPMIELNEISINEIGQIS